MALTPRESPINRREFLGASAANAAGMAAAGVVGWTGTAGTRPAPSERVSVGVIGIRSQGKTLATTLAGMPNVEVAVLCDVDESLLPQAAREIESLQGHSPQMATDFRRLLDDPALDAVVIATPDHWHALITVLACEAGKDGRTSGVGAFALQGVKDFLNGVSHYEARYAL